MGNKSILRHIYGEAFNQLTLHSRSRTTSPSDSKSFHLKTRLSLLWLHVYLGCVPFTDRGEAFPYPCPSLTSLCFTPQIISNSPGDQSRPAFHTGQEWGMYLVNHLFKRKKENHTSNPPFSLCLTTHLFPLLSASSWGPAFHLSRQILICRENKLAILFRRWMSGKGLGNIVRLHKNTRSWWINPSCTEIWQSVWTSSNWGCVCVS